MKYQKLLDTLLLTIYLSAIIYGAWVDDPLLRAGCYAVAGLYFLWVATLRMRLSGMGIAIHLLPVAYRVFIGHFFDEWSGWARLHSITIVVSASFIGIDLYRDREKSRGLEKQKPDN